MDGLLEKADGKWRLRLGELAGEFEEAESLRRMAEQRRDEFDELGTEDASLNQDVLRVAAACGAVTSLPFLDIVEGEGFRKVPCLCCATVAERRAARKAQDTLKTFMRYYNPQSYLRSRAFVRMAAQLARDVTPEEARWLAGVFTTYECVTDSVREINRLADGSLCVVSPICLAAGVTLWVYSSPEGRRLLRHLAKKIAVTVSVASSDLTKFPRYRHRMYSVTVLRTTDDPRVLEWLTLEWVRRRN